ncbi:MAG: VOC family protein [Tsuneonella sp.]
MAAPALPIRQVAYFVPDIAKAAAEHSAAFGSGPFFIARHVPLAWSEHRGVRVTHDHSSAYGQWGEVMIEFVEQAGGDPSAFHDLYPAGSGRFDFHHAALFVDDLDDAIADFARKGMALAQISETMSGVRYAFVDGAAQLGHMLELYEPSEGLTGFYAMVADAAKGWDGADPVREMG